jgi:hypothetical protein
MYGSAILRIIDSGVGKNSSALYIGSFQFVVVVSVHYHGRSAFTAQVDKKKPSGSIPNGFAHPYVVMDGFLPTCKVGFGQYFVSVRRELQRRGDLLLC